MENDVINQVFPQEGRVQSSEAARKVVEALSTNVGYLLTNLNTRTYFQFVDGIAFQIRKPNVQANYCRITVTGDHTYTLWLTLVEVGENRLHVKTICKIRKLGSETLREVFEEELGFIIERRSSVVVRTLESEQPLAQQA